MAGFSGPMEQRFPLESFALIGDLVFEYAFFAIAMHLDGDCSLSQKRLREALPYQLTQSIPFDGLLFDLVGKLQVTMLDRVQEQLLKRASKMQLRRIRQGRRGGSDQPGHDAGNMVGIRVDRQRVAGALDAGRIP